jgi:hypothetical protein
MPYQRFIFELAGSVEIGQLITGDETEVTLALAGDIVVHWIPPLNFNSMLSFTGRFTGGVAESGRMSTFTPITAISHGEILEAEIPGISILSLNYIARLHETFSASASISSFIRSDRGTFIAYPVTDDSESGYILGTEFFGRVIWSPVSDMTINMGAGSFMPSLGNVSPNADSRWRVTLAATFALY